MNTIKNNIQLNKKKKQLKKIKSTKNYKIKLIKFCAPSSKQKEIQKYI